MATGSTDAPTADERKKLLEKLLSPEYRARVAAWWDAALRAKREGRPVKAAR